MTPNEAFLSARIAATALLASGNAFAASFESEAIMQAFPPGYRVENRASQGNTEIYEAYPDGQNFANWTEIVTTHVVVGLTTVTPEQFRENMIGHWERACPDSIIGAATSGVDRGYPFVLWVMECRSNPATGRDEASITRAIRGNENFYVVQKSFRYIPAAKDVSYWTQYLGTVWLCDERRKDNRCPALNPWD